MASGLKFTCSRSTTRPSSASSDSNSNTAEPGAARVILRAQIEVELKIKAVIEASPEVLSGNYMRHRILREWRFACHQMPAIIQPPSASPKLLQLCFGQVDSRAGVAQEQHVASQLQPGACCCRCSLRPRSRRLTGSVHQGKLIEALLAHHVQGRQCFSAACDGAGHS
jgi:hypothetical protein